MFDLSASALDHDLSDPRQNVAYARRPLKVDASRTEAFPRDEEGLAFEGAVLPCFGLWRGVEPSLRKRLADRLIVHRHRGSHDYAIELCGAPGQERVVLARFAASSLGSAAQGVETRLRRGAGVWGRLRGQDRFGSGDVLRIPPLHLRLDHPQGAVTVDLDGAGATEPPPTELTLGRGEMYRRYFQLNEPFIVWVGAPGNNLETLFVAWLGHP